MLGFLFKIILVAGLVVGGAWYLGGKSGKVDTSKLLSSLPLDFSVVDRVREVKPGEVKEQISSALDALVTHPGRNSGPVVLGVKVSNDTIGTVTDVLMGLPSEQLDQVKEVICSPQ